MLSLQRRSGMGHKHIVSIALLVSVLAVAGCGSGTKARARPQLMLRGVPVTRFACPTQPTSPVSNASRIVGVQAVLLCPLSVPGVSGAKAVTISKGQPGFAPLLAALSVPDETRTTGACAAYADLPQVVLARTARGPYQVSIPVDACRHYQARALAALKRAREK